MLNQNKKFNDVRVVNNNDIIRGYLYEFWRKTSYSLVNICYMMKATQGGEIGLVIGSESFEPYSSKLEDVAAADRLTDFLIGWLVLLIKPFLVQYLSSISLTIDVWTKLLCLYISTNRILDPVVYGDYPKIMRELVGNRLPNFTEDEKKMVAGSIDFIGINYYTSHFAKHETNKTNITLSDNYDALARSEGEFFLTIFY